MKMRREGAREQDYLPVLCHVEQEDIDLMVKGSESGMVDCSTRNAIALALRRSLKVSQPIGVRHWYLSNGYHCCVGDDSFRLPTEVSKWLDNFRQGLIGKPFAFIAQVPAQLNDTKSAPA